MKIQIKSGVYITLFVAFALTSRAQTANYNERGLWDLWCAGTNSAFEAAEILDRCREFKSGSPSDPLTLVVSGFEAWHCLKKGRTADAVKLFESMMVADSRRAIDVQNAADKMARCWLTRLDREQVIAALRKIYLRDIEFPASLDALNTLKITPPPPLKDRWNNPWDYRTGSAIKGMATQRYVLESSTLGVYSDLKGALELRYADRIDLKPVRMLPNVKNAIEFRSGSGTSVTRQAGDFANRINLAYIGTHIIVLTDGNHWSVLPKPR